MSTKHPIIAVTGSSGAGTSTVKKAFEHIFQREDVNAAVIEGDSFHSLNRVEFKAAIATAFSQLTYAQASSRLDEQGITYGPVQTMSEVLLDKQLRANGVIVETGDAGDDYKLTIGSPINIKGEAKKTPKRGPDIGADSLSVLRSFDLDESYIQELLNQGVIVDGSAS